MLRVLHSFFGVLKESPMTKQVLTNGNLHRLLHPGKRRPSTFARNHSETFGSVVSGTNFGVHHESKSTNKLVYLRL